MVIDYEKLSQAIKVFAKVCSPLMKLLMRAWDQFKRLAKEYILHLPKHPKVIHPAVRINQYRSYRMQSQMLLNKPVRVRARSCC